MAEPAAGSGGRGCGRPHRDQVNLNRCGGKDVVDQATALQRIAAAGLRDPAFLIAARNDIRGIERLQAAKDHAKVLVDAGADAIFPEAMASIEEFAVIHETVDVPVLARMTESDKSELSTTL